jgi:NADH dehydrogenase
VHITYLIGLQNRLFVLIRWAFSFVTRGRGARLITDPAAELPVGLRGQLAADRSPVLRSEAPPVGTLESMKQLE